MAEESKGTEADATDHDMKFQDRLIESSRENLKKDSPALYAILNKYKDHNADKSGD